MGSSIKTIEKFDIPLMRTAELWGEQSKCNRRKVGAVIAKESRIISTGYNGTPSGFFPDECEENGITKPIVIHAEANAILFAAKNGISTKDCTLYVTLSPCIECAKMILQSGIKRLVYKEDYKDLSGIMLLKNYIEVQKLEDLT